MESTEFLTNIIENIIASIPQFVAVVAIVVLSIKKLRETTNLFPEELMKTEKTLHDSFNGMDNQVQTALDNFQAKTNQMVESSFKEITEKVTDVMSGMEKELKTYREQLQAVKAQMNFLIKENRALIDIIINLVAKNPDMVKNGISSQVLDMLNMTQEELLKYSSQMIDNLPLLETVLKEATVNFDSEDIETIFGGIGYVKADE